MNILGFNSYGHDSAATLVVDNRVVFAVEEERLNRKKHYGGIPERSIRACLDFANLRLEDLDHVAFFWNPWISYSKVPLFFFRYPHRVPALLREQRHFTVEENLGMLNYLGDMRRLRGTLCGLFRDSRPVRFRFHLLEHHLCHAASTFYPSGFDEAAILTIDGAGEWTTALLAHGQGNRIRKIGGTDTPHSLGAFYQAVARHLGFKLLTGPGKLMGLASFGDPDAGPYRQMRRLVDLRDDGSFRLDMSYFSYHYTRKTGVSEKFERLFGPSATRQPPEWTEQQKDVAAAAQRVVEDVILHMAESLRKRTGARKLCVAGGVGLNAVANGLLTKSGLYDEVFIQPAAGDSGTSLGAALLLNQQMLGRPRDWTMRTAFLGPSYGDADYRREIERSGLPFVRSDGYPEFAARRLAQGKILGWHQGRLEFGPRALGNRSIIADATRPEMKDTLNARVKFREAFRPFAAIVLEEDCGEYFDWSEPSPYMLKVYEVRERYRDVLPSITHVDHTVRIQTVGQEENPEMRRLLEAFKREKGVGALINTSFNVKGEPIVCSPHDAVDTFVRSDIDYLILGNYIVARPDDEEAIRPWAG
jgi:carbamoyltransferase